MQTARLLPLLLAAALPAFASDLSVTVSPDSFAPSLGRQVTYTVTCPIGGVLDAAVLDRDGYRVRTLAAKKRVPKGPVTLAWGGRDDAGVVVPDEAYSLRVVLRGEGGEALTFFPANGPAEMYEVPKVSFDQPSGTLSYSLPKPSRVHLQAGIVKEDPVTKQKTGPVLKTVVNRAPRPGGSIVDAWSGFDEGKTVYVPSLPTFVVSLMATSLPTASVITVGNRNLDPLTYASRRTGKSLFTWHAAAQAHHAGLNALQDHAPPVSLSIDGRWDAKERVWEVGTPTVHLATRLEETANAAAFAKLARVVLVYLDEKQVKSIPVTSTSAQCDLSIQDLGPGPHVLAVNWATSAGPTAVNAVRVRKAVAVNDASSTHAPAEHPQEHSR